MGSVSIALITVVFCLALMLALSALREVLLKKERDEWVRKFERRNRKEWYEK